MINSFNTIGVQKQAALLFFEVFSCSFRSMHLPHTEKIDPIL